MEKFNFRKTWDSKEYLAKAIQRIQNEQNVSQLQPKELTTHKAIEWDKKLRRKKIAIGRTVIKSSDPKKNFYCDICLVQSNDSLSYISHLNSKEHLKNIGKDLYVERSSLKQVRERFELAKEKMTMELTPYERHVKMNKTKNKKTEEKPAIEEVDEETARMNDIMGFSSFT